MSEEFEGMLQEQVTYQEPAETLAEEVAQPQKKAKRKKWPIVLALFIGLFLGVSFTIIIGKSYVDSQMASLLQNPDGKLAYLKFLIKDYYYQDIDDEKLQEGAYYGLFESLDDPYSQYYTAEEYADYSSVVTGNYGGIGAVLQKDNESGEVTIMKVYSDTPAEKSGLKEGDIIVSADGILAVDYSLDDFVASYVRGEAGTDVELVLNREGEEITVVCTRDTIVTRTVEYQMLDNNIGYIAVSQFTEHTYDDFVAAYEDLEAQGMEAVVFDMRNNGGGLVDSVVDMLDYLLPEGTVVYTMDHAGNREDKKSDASCKNIPMTVLVNGNTASAAEIFTGAIRDFDYGTIIGTQTYGKGIMQSSMMLQDGSAIKLTTHTYYTPSGECIHGTGITPDVVLEYEFLGGEDDVYSVEYDNQLQKAIEVLQGE